LPHYSPELIEKIVREAVARCLDELGKKTTPPKTPEELLFRSARAEDLKREIVSVGRKLWQREYVDGNGGNISCRLTDELVLCTPTMCSKADLMTEDISMVDLENTRVCGSAAQTSEVRLHLSIYKAVPEARAVVHCHPPHATAYAITGLCPPLEILPEHEVFVGPVPISPYETPGTQAFADTVVPLVQRHNTVLLANHGVVCWADTPTHAEWLVEVLDTYCRTLMLAHQLGRPLTHIPHEKIVDLLAIKKKLGIPDARNWSENGVSPRSVPSEID